MFNMQTLCLLLIFHEQFVALLHINIQLLPVVVLEIEVFVALLTFVCLF